MKFSPGSGAGQTSVDSGTAGRAKAEGAASASSITVETTMADAPARRENSPVGIPSLRNLGSDPTKPTPRM
jgi:hypothetical protein